MLRGVHGAQRGRSCQLEVAYRGDLQELHLYRHDLVIGFWFHCSNLHLQLVLRVSL